ncbi:MAG: hypothetical protein UU08_C0009G0025 [Candidatus Uhrbacteria bacterium GW2011_GWE2_40_58]|nr:MAG: hypothetical protein UT94_C0030G0011 [Candidatus Uhrbacteria bacterium GW2011_GWF2_40_263]KKR67763.1 MAG: hypothetical protein UU08_C0009G0025 [Candidatus Uhrbacteria bacterium GW2011_GWE2_40_58]
MVFILFLPLFVAHAEGLTNPLGTTDLRLIIGNIIRAILGLTGVLALVMFIYGGILWMVSSGEPTKVKKGMNTLIWAALGLVVIFSAYALTTTLITGIATGSISIST